MRPEPTVVLQRRAVLGASIARVRLAAIPPVKVASMPQGVGPLSFSARAR